MDAMPNDDTLAMRRDWTNQVIQNILIQPVSINQSRETSYRGLVQQKILHLSINQSIIIAFKHSVTLKELSREKKPEKAN